MTWIILDRVLDDAHELEHLELTQQTCIKVVYFYAYRVASDVEYKRIVQEHGLPPTKRYHLLKFQLRDDVRLNFTSVELESAQFMQIQKPLGCDKLFLEFGFEHMKEITTVYCFTEDAQRH